MADKSAIEWTDASLTPIRVGKRRAGRMLDSVEHSAFPETKR